MALKKALKKKAEDYKTYRSLYFDKYKPLKDEQKKKQRTSRPKFTKEMRKAYNEYKKAKAVWRTFNYKANIEEKQKAAIKA